MTTICRRAMHVEQVDERDSSWEEYGPRFRVHLFDGGDEPYRSWRTGGLTWLVGMDANGN